MACFDKNNLLAIFDSIKKRERQDIVVVLLNIVLNISKMACFYCDCSSSIKACSVCELARTFFGYHFIIYRYSLNFRVGSGCSDAIIQKVYHQLESLVDENPYFVERIVNTKVYYAIESFFSGKKSSYSTEYFLEKLEKTVIALKGHPDFEAEFKKLLLPDGFFKIMVKKD